MYFFAIETTRRRFDMMSCSLARSLSASPRLTFATSTRSSPCVIEYRASSARTASRYFWMRRRCNALSSSLLSRSSATWARLMSRSLRRKRLSISLTRSTTRLRSGPVKASSTISDETFSSRRSISRSISW